VSTPRLVPWIAVALCAHGVAFAASDGGVGPVEPHVTPLEVELATETDPEPPPPLAPDPEPAELPPDPVARAPTKMAPRPAANPPPRAAPRGAVGALLTTGETADSADPVAFLSDPNGDVYGSGVVARGGRAAEGSRLLPGPAVAEAPRQNTADVVTPAADLTRAPSLDAADACRGFFPTEAAVDTAKVDLIVIVQANGRVASVSIAGESPAGEGFGAAARACLLSQRFTPGKSRAGRAVAASASVRLHFTR
jgi:periplasmic protein TonB